jgi:hypothetical protein
MLWRAKTWAVLSAYLLLLTCPASATETGCSKPRGGQYAEEVICATTALLPDGSAGTSAMLDAIPEQYPWLFRVEDPANPPALTVKVTPTDAEFSVLQIYNGYSSYQTDGSENPPFAKYGRAKDVLIETAAGHSLKLTLADNQEPQFLSLPAPAGKEWVKITVVSAYPGQGDIAALRWFSIAWEAE